MFGRKRIRSLEAQLNACREALDWYAVNDNWKRHSTHAKGTPVRWEMSPAQRDHGGRARAAVEASRQVRTHARGLFSTWRTKHQGESATDAAWKKHVEAARKVSVTVPAARPNAPEVDRTRRPVE